jgi:DNA (cytosine-5)-methyltransferase 1
MVVGEIPTQVHCYLVKHAADRLSHTNNVDTTKTITHVSLCAGYGGIDLGLGRAIPNLRTIAFSEIEAFACANLVSKMEAGLLDAAPIWTNLKTFPWADFRDRVDILSGGYPCQPFSAAGKRLGKEDPRHLWPWIADGIAAMRPRVCFFENVEGHISLGLREVIEDLERLGYNSTWGIFSASEVGAPHQRKRVFISAHCKSNVRSIEETGDWRQVSSGGGSEAWPSRPGQPQHEWEPPRVVGNSTKQGLPFSGVECGAVQQSGSEQESERSDESMAHTHGTSSGSNGKYRGQLGLQPQGGANRRDERDTERTENGICQAQPSLGGDSDGYPDWMDYAELYVTSDNRTDELRLLGNGVVPATAERAFRVLLNQILNQ